MKRMLENLISERKKPVKEEEFYKNFDTEFEIGKYKKKSCEIKEMRDFEEE